MWTTSYARTLRKNQTDAEKTLWHHLRNRQLVGEKFRRQQPINGYFVDFVCLEQKLIIELDGSHHNEREVRAYDTYRTSQLMRDGYRVIRFWDNEIFKNINGVLERIQKSLNSPHPNPLP